MSICGADIFRKGSSLPPVTCHVSCVTFHVSYNVVGKRLYKTGMNISNKHTFPYFAVSVHSTFITAGPEEEGVGSIENMKRMGDFGFSEKTRPRMGKRMFNNGMY